MADFIKSAKSQLYMFIISNIVYSAPTQSKELESSSTPLTKKQVY